MKWLHKLLKYSSFTAVLFVFQCCYGDLSDDYYNDGIEFYVVNEKGEGISEVEVLGKLKETDDWKYLNSTRYNGEVHIRISEIRDTVWFKFKPADTLPYQEKDTVIKYYGWETIEIKLEEK